MRNLIIITFFAMAPFSIVGQISENIDLYLEPIVENQDFSGVVLITDEDGIAHFGAYGLGNIEWQEKTRRNSVFHIASLTKQFTAAAILIAEQKGLLSLNDPISKFLPDYPSAKKITIQHLLSQRSGIPDYNDLDGYSEFAMRNVELDEVIQWIRDYPLEFVPGSNYSYSNSNYTLAARILELASGKSYSEFLQDEIFDPLDMNRTGNYTYQEIVPFRAVGYDPAPGGVKQAPYYNKSFKIGSGALYSTAEDLLKWDTALYSTKILTEASKEKLFHDYGNNYGLGWGVYTQNTGEKFASHDGKSPGYFSYMKRYFEGDKKTIIILSNINSGIMNKMKTDITNIVFGRDYPTYEKISKTEVPSKVSEYVGHYDFPPDNYFEIVEKEGQLYFRWKDTDFLQYLTPISGDKFLMRSRYDKLIFNRNSNGEVNSIDYVQGKDVTQCPKKDQ